MSVAHATTCPCDEQGFQTLVWDDERKQMRLGGHDEYPSLRVPCTDCGTGNRHAAVGQLTQGPVAPITQDEIDELQCELLSVREEIHREEALRPHVDAALIERHDQLATVEALCDLEDEIAQHAQQGVTTTPALLVHREELRAQVRELLAATA